jgi:hypothetical protein
MTGCTLTGLTGFTGFGGGATGTGAEILPLGDGTATAPVTVIARIAMKLVSCMMKLKRLGFSFVELGGVVGSCCALMIFQQVRGPILIVVCPWPELLSAENIRIGLKFNFRFSGSHKFV